MPPLSLTQSKYAFAMPVTAVKSVPGIFVAIAPSSIGSPDALRPLPRPHFDAGAPVCPAVVPALPPARPASSSPSPPQATTPSDTVAASASAAIARRLEPT